MMVRCESMKMSLKFLPLLLALASTALAVPQSTPPWSKGANDPAGQQGYVFRVPDVDNVPDLHGNPSDAKLVIFIGGNQFFVLPQLITAFEQHHPELKGHIFYETLPPGILRKQIAAHDAITLGNLTIQVGGMCTRRAPASSEKWNIMARSRASFNTRRMIWRSWFRLAFQRAFSR